MRTDVNFSLGSVQYQMVLSKAGMEYSIASFQAQNKAQQALPQELTSLIAELPASGLSYRELRKKLTTLGAQWKLNQKAAGPASCFLAMEKGVSKLPSASALATQAVSVPASSPSKSTLQTVAKNFADFITEGSQANGNPKQLFQAWMLMNFNSLKFSSILTTASDDDFPEEFCSLMRSELRLRMQKLVHESPALDSDELTLLNQRYLIKHAIASYSYFRPEQEPSCDLPRMDATGCWKMVKHELTSFAQASSLIEAPGLTYAFLPTEKIEDLGPLVLFRGTPPSSSQGRCMARLDNFTPFGAGYFQWNYVCKPLTNYLNQTQGRIDVIGHSQGGGLALRLAAYAAKNLTDRKLDIDADSPAGDESFRGLSTSGHQIYVYAHKNDLVPLKSGAIPASAKVLYGLADQSPALAHVHIGSHNEICTGVDYNKLAGHHPVKQFFKKIGVIPLSIFYTIALIGKAVRTLCEWPFRAVINPPFKTLTTLQKIACILANILLIAPRLVAKTAIMIGHGIPFSIQWLSALATGAVPYQAIGFSPL